MSIEIAKNLLKTLNQIERPGDFCTSGTMEPCFPGLEVKKVGHIGFPLSDVQAKEIIKQCSQAPYGKGEETIIDRDVRRVWQLEPKQFDFNNPEWEIKIKKILKEIQNQLGLESKKISSELYKLLIYEKDDFFVSHRDTEKADNMFGTLVIVLPSKHKGGDLTVEHDGKTSKFAFGNKNSIHKIQYAAFYTDCKHEVKKVTEGYRMCLIYNLSVSGLKAQPSAPKNSDMLKNITNILKQWSVESDPVKLAVLLEHKYTEAGISFDFLKNLDRTKAELLVQAGKDANCVAHLALVTLWEAGDAECDRNYGYNDYDNDEDDYEMGEIYDTSLEVNHWIDANGVKNDIGTINIDKSEIVSKHGISDGTPDDEDVEGPTGNAGASIERWYRRAAITLWPKQRHFEVICESGQDKMMPKLQNMVKCWEKSGKLKNSEELKQCQLFARGIIKNWHEPARYEFDDSNTSSQEMLTLLRTIDDEALIKQFIENCIPINFYGTEGKELALICKQYGWDNFKDKIGLLAEQNEVNKSIEFAQILEYLCQQKSKTNKEQNSVCLYLAKKAVTNIIEWDTDKKQKTYYYYSNKKSNIELVESMFKALCSINDTESLETLVKHFINDTKHYNTRDVLIPAVKNLHNWIEKQTNYKTFYNKLLKHCTLEVQNARSKPVEKPKDWFQDIKIACDCVDCQKLNAFLKDPNEKVHRFSVRKDRRQHLHQKITSYKCDMTHVTDRKGSPQTLVCTKNIDSYNTKKKQEKLDLVFLDELESIGKKIKKK